MQTFDPKLLKKLYIPHASSHKGQNGKLFIIGGSHLFHAASLWSLKVASRVVDMVFYSSVPENNEIVQKAKEEFRDGIVVSRSEIDHYAKEADCILIGPGMMRSESEMKNILPQSKTLKEINELSDEGEQTYYLTNYLLKTYPEKKFVIDAGALQMMNCGWLLSYRTEHAILTPHKQEFTMLFGEEATEGNVRRMAGWHEGHDCVILLKGEKDIVSDGKESAVVTGGNAGMTKGGTGDVLAGLVAALYCKNDAFLAAAAGSYINKKAGESLAERVGTNYNASDLCDEIPKVMKELL